MEFGILGPLQVLRDGQAIEPGSPKLRALLVNLVLHAGHVVSRDRLIEDLWAGSPPSTGLGVLQNYVSQLRKTLGSGVVVTRGTGYALAVEPAAIDSVRFEALVADGRAALDAADASGAAEAFRRALGLWRGPALADVSGEPFAQAEISRLQELHAGALELELEAAISIGRHREAVARLEAAVAEHPFRERLWWLLMMALYRSDRQADALRAYQRARSALADELGLEPGAELRELEQAVLGQRSDLDALLVSERTRRRSPRRLRPRTSLLGRVDEWSAIAAHLDGPEDSTRGLLLLVGEPGIGKTRLLEEAHTRAADDSGVVVSGRAFEVERGRPYGVWVDALRAIPLPAIDDVLRTDLAALLPELTDQRAELDDANRLYDAVVETLRQLANDAPVSVLVDDLHWLDEASLSLLHFALRHLADDGVAFVATARPAELGDNVACTRMLQALRRDDALAELWIGPLAPATIAELTASIAPSADAEQIAKATHGNPLFALEMAKALARGDEPLSSRVDALIGDRLARLDDQATVLLPWIAAFGRGVSPTVLARLVEREPLHLFEPLGDLERHGIVRADDDGSFDFVHDLVRGVAYKRLSASRQAMLHARIGAVLAAMPDPDDTLAADTVRHADLGGDSATCAAAAARAARRCLRLLAYRDVEDLVALGRGHARRLAPEQRVGVELELIHVLLHPGVRLRQPGDLAGDLTNLCAEAQRLGLDTELSRGLSLLARAYHWGWGDIPRARALLERAAQLIESARVPSLEPLLESARCLAYLEMDMARTRRLFDDLGALDQLAAASVQYQWGLGLVRAWNGETEEARHALTKATELSTARADHWITFECTARLALIELEAGALDAAEPLCAQLATLAAKLGHGSEGPYARAICSLQTVARGEHRSDDELDAAVTALERIDARFLIPDVLGIAAELYHRAGRLDIATHAAERALRAAGEVARPAEAARARSLLACIAAERGDLDTARAHLNSDTDPGCLPHHVKRLRREAEHLIDARHPSKE